MITLTVKRRALPEDLILMAEASKKDEEIWKVYMEYEEDGEFLYQIEEHLPTAVVRKLLNPRMLQLLDVLSSRQGVSITEIAEILGRSVPNVYRDLKYLASYNFVYFRSEGRKKIPILLLREIRLIIH